MNTPTKAEQVEAVVRKVMDVFDEIDWNQKSRNPTNSEVLRGEKASHPQKKLALTQIISTLIEAGEKSATPMSVNVEEIKKQAQLKALKRFEKKYPQDYKVLCEYIGEIAIKMDKNLTEAIKQSEARVREEERERIMSWAKQNRNTIWNDYTDEVVIYEDLMEAIITPKQPL